MILPAGLAQALPWHVRQYQRIASAGQFSCTASIDCAGESLTTSERACVLSRATCHCLWVD